MKLLWLAMATASPKSMRSELPSWASALCLLLLIAGLPLALWRELHHSIKQSLLQQASNCYSVITSVRGYCTCNAVGQVLLATKRSKAVHNHAETPDAIPLPATQSLGLSKVVGALNGKWWSASIKRSFQVEMGTNTSFCNFGSGDRLHRGVIGAKANLAVRLQTVAEPSAL